MDNSDVIAKVQKLLKLAEKSTYQGEAESAAAMAQALIDKHKLTSAMLETSDVLEAIKDFKGSPLNEGDPGAQKSSWKARLASTLARLNGCEILTYRGALDIIGKPSNVQTVRYLYTFCVRAMESVVRARTAGMGRIYINNFRIGFIEGISEAIKREREAQIQGMREALNGSRELVVLNNAVAVMKQEYDTTKNYCKTVMGLRYGSSRSSSRYNSDARSAGRSAGSSAYGGSRGQISGAAKRIG